MIGILTYLMLLISAVLLLTDFSTDVYTKYSATNKIKYYFIF